MTIKRMPVAHGVVADRFSSGEPLSGARAAASAQTRREKHCALNAADGTRQLLVSGAWTMLVGVLAGLLTAFVFGGMGPQGAHSNAGWLSLMVAMMSTPFAILLLLLGGAKWLRNYRLSKSPSAL